MTDQKAAEGPQEGSGGGSAGIAPSEPLTGAQAGAGSLGAHNAGPTVAECAEADRRWWNAEKAGE
ncbi:hypothetical protein ACIQW4_01130 [Streptomyces albogriseolus]|uniref:hypothetical protein n=1 Tax=Streptomyces albogriseolus TaxID=1887 RepID=UPI00382D2114